MVKYKSKTKPKNNKINKKNKVSQLYGHSNTHIVSMVNDIKVSFLSTLFKTMHFKRLFVLLYIFVHIIIFHFYILKLMCLVKGEML